MSSSIPDHDFNDVEPVLAEAGKLATQFRHGFIDYHHLFVAMLTTDCMAKKFCDHCNTAEWTSWLQKTYPPNGTQTMEEDSLPLTAVAERIIHHASSIARKCDETDFNSVHLLLAILVPADDISSSFEKEGILFEDVVAAYGKPPFGKFPPVFRPFRQKQYSKWMRFFVSSSSLKKKVAELYGVAYILWKYDQYDQCIDACSVILSLDAGHNSSKALQMYCHFRKRDFQESLRLITPLIGLNPDSKSHLINMAYMYDEMGEYGKASNILDELLAKFPEDRMVFNNKGFNLSRQGKYKEAVPFFEKTIAIDPSFAYPWNNMGFAQYKLGDVEQGLSLIDRSLELDKGNSYAYKNKGIIFFEQNNKAEALKNFQLALKFNYTEKYGGEVEEWMRKFD
jgi:tetratricopeptide (TPR) repeat protein